MREKNPGVAFILSFFIPGLGQFYNQRIMAGFGFLISFFAVPWFLFLVLVFLTPRFGDANYGHRGMLTEMSTVLMPIVWTVITWIINLIHAYKSAVTYNKKLNATR